MPYTLGSALDLKFGFLTLYFFLSVFQLSTVSITVVEKDAFIAGEGLFSPLISLSQNLFLNHHSIFLNPKM